jgi:hypothetical protein
MRTRAGLKETKGFSMRGKILFCFALCSSALAFAFDYESRGALAVKASDPTRFMMGYCIWFSPTGAEYNWANPDKYSDSYNQTQRIAETNALAA